MIIWFLDICLSIQVTDKYDSKDMISDAIQVISGVKIDHFRFDHPFLPFRTLFQRFCILNFPGDGS
ncbi:MAG: hypothetical protein A2V50_01860 [Bacteroidetes bacterium RBG_19FT_COMBO_42_10]|nr:MAG: hypothetical protein A2V50_01860 [Bacteroidetes bacterium RBG_19FT_COMBO_42_10]